jgi:hypothetical protein
VTLNQYEDDAKFEMLQINSKLNPTTTILTHN